jgi:hypothetical protein
MKRSEFVNSMKSLGGIIANVTQHSFPECMSESYKLGDLGYFGMSHEDFKLKNYQSDSKKRLDNIDSFHSYHFQAIEEIVKKYNILIIADEVYYPDTTTPVSALTDKNWEVTELTEKKEGLYCSFDSSRCILVTSGKTFTISDNLIPFNSVLRQITEELLSQDRLDLLEINRIDKSTYNWFLNELGREEISAEKIRFS